MILVVSDAGLSRNELATDVGELILRVDAADWQRLGGRRMILSPVESYLADGYQSVRPSLRNCGRAALLLTIVRKTGWQRRPFQHSYTEGGEAILKASVSRSTGSPAAGGW